jgi:hypothetical protein
VTKSGLGYRLVWGKFLFSSLLFSARALALPELVVDEDIALAKQTVKCCKMPGPCVELPAQACKSAPAPMPPPPPVQRDPVVEREDAMMLSEFGVSYFPRETLRGQVASAIFGGYTSVFVGSVEGEYAQEMPDPISGLWTIMTWCQVRVVKTFKGEVRPGDVVTVLYYGGAISRDRQFWPHHRARCSPFDIQYVATVEHLPGVVQTDEVLSQSLQPWDGRWEDRDVVQMTKAMVRP